MPSLREDHDYQWLRGDFSLYMARHEVTDGRTSWSYEFYDKDRMVFIGSDFGAPMHQEAWECHISLLGYLCLEEGDTDAEYFASYTSAMLSWRDSNRRDMLADYLRADSGVYEALVHMDDRDQFRVMDEAATKFQELKRSNPDVAEYVEALLGDGGQVAEVVAIEDMPPLDEHYYAITPDSSGMYHFTDFGDMVAWLAMNPKGCRIESELVDPEFRKQFGDDQ
jgi:hypothetical protein